jgi:outer membrane protein TolC
VYPLFLALLLTVLPVSSGWAQPGQQPAVPDFSRITVLDLDTAQRLALQGNPGIDAAQARLEQARAKVRQAVAAWWPSVDLTGSAARSSYSDVNFASASLMSDVDKTYNSSSIGLNATWVLFDGFSRSFKQEQAEFAEKSSLAAHRNSQRLLVAAVAKAFFNAQLAETKIRIAEADSKFYQKQLLDANNRYEVGTGSWGDVLNIKVQLNSAKTSFMLSKREYEAAGYGLAALLGISDAALPDTVQLAELDKDFKPSEDILSRDIDTLINEALQTRPDLKKLTMQIREAEAAAGQAKAPFWPTVTLKGQVNGNHQGAFALNDEDFGNSIAINASWNLFAGGANQAALAAARQKRREASCSMTDLRNSVASEIRQDLALLAAATEQVRLQRESVALVEENRQLAQSEYEAGSASLVRLNEAQRDLTTTYGRLAQALVSYHKNRQELLAATGRNLLPFADLIDQPAD